MEEIHRLLTAALRFAENTLKSGTSMHSTQNSVHLNVLREALDVAGEFKNRLFVGAIDDKIVITANNNIDAESATTEDTIDGRGKKRQRCTHEEEVANDAIERIERSKGGDAISNKSKKAASRAIIHLLKNLRGVYKERAIESWNLSINQESKLILVVKISPGVAVSLETLVTSVLGATDGMLTISSDLFKGNHLPVCKEAKITETLGKQHAAIFCATLEPPRER